MFNFIQADLFRLFHKKSNYFYYGVLYALFFILAIFLYSTFAENGENFTDGYMQMGLFLLAQTFPIFFGLQAYSTVYLNELSSNSYQNIFSSGLSKVEFVIGKFIVMVTYLCATFLSGAVAYLVPYGVMTVIEGTTFDTTGFINLVNTSLTIFLGMIAYASLANIIAYFSQNNTIAIITFGALISTVSLTILNMVSLVTDKFEFLREFTLSYYIQKANNTVSLTLLEQTEKIDVPYEAWGVALIYLFIASLIGIIILNKIEIKEGK
ncbi:ABC transporter permease [Marinilactibacillus psychrotolerans]|uniref:ABC transporter permease n=1 Tax=Marinilactibacillus psychrotolerans TaxID=191770 RepID=UPI0039AFDC44